MVRLLALKNLEIILLTLLISLSSLSCSESSNSDLSSQFPNSKPSIYFKSSLSIELEVHYEIGAEPDAGDFNNGNPVWSIAEDNLEQIFSFRSSVPSVVVPLTLSEMYSLQAQSKASWSVNDVISLHNSNHIKDSTPSTSVFYIYFLNGNAESGTSTIGFSINGTPVIAIFKSVIENAGNSRLERRYIEQSTIVHEMGHALGFVNNGVPISAPHQDVEHGAHTENSDCVMYWLNEGVSDLRSFLAAYIVSGSTQMWGAEVLQDAQDFSE